MTDSDLTRRRFLGRAASLTLMSSSLLTACGGVEGTAKKTPTAAPAASHPKTALTEIEFSNWPLYIDKKVIRDFEREQGVDLRYVEDINDNTEFFAKVRQQLESGRPTGRDLVALTDWMAAQWIRLGYLEPVDKRNLPNVVANLEESLRDPVFDKGRRFTVPWQSGITGIGYNRKAVGEIKSMKQLFDPRFKGKVSFLSDARDSASMVLLMDGIRPDEANIDQVKSAIEKIDEQNRAGQIRRFTGNDYTTDLAKGNVVMAMAYAADLIQLKADNPDLDFVIPEEGGTIWTDNMMLPKTTKNQYAAETMINYVYDPAVAAKIAAYVNYVTPVVGAKEALAESDPETADNQLIFPDEATLAKLHPYVDLNEDEEKQMNEAMQAVVGA